MMVTKYTVRGATALVVCLLLTTDATAFSRRHPACCVPVCCPAPCPPWFALYARLKNPSGYVEGVQGAPLPVDVFVTNFECYWWQYYNSEYDFYVFDSWGRFVPNALIRTTELRSIWVYPCATTLDEPKLFLNMHVLQLGHRYTLIVGLRGHYSCLHFTPILEANK
jgi:hypothetical protein